MGITHVVRGSEYLSSAPKYNLLYQGFGWDVPTYIHCSPVMRDQHSKMSKRKGDPSYEDLLAMGYLSEAVVNYVTLLGWSPRGEDASGSSSPWPSWPGLSTWRASPSPPPSSTSKS